MTQGKNMNKQLLTYFYIVVGLGLMLATPAWADFQAGVDAYNRGDYETALKEFRPLADQGDAEAQLNLGDLYHFGFLDNKEAAKWYRLAAEQGNAEAQSNLGLMYENGQGVPQDYQEAVKWYRLAAEQGIASTKEYLETLETLMTPQQIAEAQRLAREWKPKLHEQPN